MDPLMLLLFLMLCAAGIALLLLPALSGYLPSCRLPVSDAANRCEHRAVLSEREVNVNPTRNSKGQRVRDFRVRLGNLKTEFYFS